MKLKRCAALLLCAAVLFSLAGCTGSDYKSALALYQSGDYPAAREAFTALGDYKDAADLASECTFKIIEEKMALSDFESAISELEALPSSEETQKLLTECRYGMAQAAFEAGDLSSAAEMFSELEDYGDSAEMLTECAYLEAAALYEAGEYEAANAAFRKLPGYKDADRYTLLCSLKADKDAFIDRFTEEVEASFAEHGTGHSLTEVLHEYDWTAREFYVDTEPEIDKTGVGLNFEHVNAEGSASARGSINHLVIYGFAYHRPLIEEARTAFLDTAASTMAILEPSADWSEMRSLIEGKSDALCALSGEKEEIFSEDFDFCGYSCSVLYYNFMDFKEYFLIVTIPELVDD